MSHILVVEDTDSLRDVLVTVLTLEGYQVTAAASAEEAIGLLSRETFSLVLCDLKLPQQSGIDLLRHARAHQHVPFVVMTAYGSVDIAVQAMKLGATDFITKPFDPDMLSHLVEQVLTKDRIIDRDVSRRPGHERVLVSQSLKMEVLLSQARKIACVSSPVLLCGESGTGKELLARYVHDHSGRNDQPFIALNCASIPQELLESELFGHEAGSFTGATEMRPGLFEVASGGTIFLDEIGDMPHQLQVKLLRALQESEIRRVGATKSIKVDVRVISATHCNLDDAIREKTFREDLFYRLAVVILEIPPLRERREDIDFLTHFFVKRSTQLLDRDDISITREALQKLRNYSWPGNVRELENVLERAVIFTKGAIDVAAIELPRQAGAAESPDATLMKSLAEISTQASRAAEIVAIREALSKSTGNKSQAARLLGVSYKTLLNKVKEYGLDL